MNHTCPKEECFKPIYAKGLCRRHYDLQCYFISPSEQLGRNKKRRKKDSEDLFTPPVSQPKRIRNPKPPERRIVDFNEDWLYF